MLEINGADYWANTRIPHFIAMKWGILQKYPVMDSVSVYAGLD
jgi:hypothetical protein